MRTQNFISVTRNLQTHITQKHSQPIQYTKLKKKKKKPISQNLTYLLKIVSVKLISDSDGGEDSDSQKREWERKSEDVVARAGTRTRHRRPTSGSPSRWVAEKANYRWF